MKTTYTAIEQLFILEGEEESHVTYGIIGREGEKEITLSHLCTAKAQVSDLALRLTQGEAALLHLRDILEDFLS